MEKTTLQKQLEAIDELFDRSEAELKASREKAKDNVWKENIESGLLKSQLETGL